MASLEDQLTEEVTSLSTKLVEAVQKQSEMADTMHNLQRELEQLRSATAPLRKSDENYRKLLPKYNRALDDVRITREARAVAEKENAKLKAEVEDLTASLFNEANEMVSNASREAYNFKVKNRKLIEELEEKDVIISSLQENLKEVKSMLYKMEDEKKRSSLTRANSLQRMGSVRSVRSIRSVSGEFVSPEQLALDEEFSDDHSALSELLFSPSVRAVRVDLNNYNHDFKAFVYTIIRPEFTYELSNLKTLRFFKKIWNEELETAITSVPQQTSIIKNWTRSKNFWNTVCDGRAKIEPVKGINENFKLSYRGNTPTADLAPVAIKEPCSFCGERRDDMLEHARLYYFKLLGENDDDVVHASYPICNYCTYKLRNICEFFAKLRYIRSNLKLTPNNAFDEFASINTTNFNFKRNQSGDLLDTQITTNSSSKVLMNSYTKRIPLDPQEEAKLLKMYLVLLYVRNKIFWSKIGVWDIPEELTESNIDAIPLEEFERLAQFPQDWAPADANDTASARSSQSYRRHSETPRGQPVDPLAPVDPIASDVTGVNSTVSEESLPTSKKTPQLAGVEEEPDATFITAKSLGDFKDKKNKNKKSKELAESVDPIDPVEPVAPLASAVPVAEPKSLDPGAAVAAEPKSFDPGAQTTDKKKKNKKSKNKSPEKEEPPLNIKKQSKPASDSTSAPVVEPQAESAALKSETPKSSSTRPKSPEIKVEPPQAVDEVVSPKKDADTKAKPTSPTKPPVEAEAKLAEPAPQLSPLKPPKVDHDVKGSDDEFHSLDEEDPIPPLSSSSANEPSAMESPDMEQFEMMPPKKKTSQPSSAKSTPQKPAAEPEVSELEQKLLKRREMASRIVSESGSPTPVAPKTVKVNLGTKSKVSDLIKKVESTETGSSRRTARQRNKHVKDESESESSPAPDQPEDLKRNTTKKFTKKMNEDLDETLEMLKDSI